MDLLMVKKDEDGPRGICQSFFLKEKQINALISLELVFDGLGSDDNHHQPYLPSSVLSLSINKGGFF